MAKGLQPQQHLPGRGLTYGYSQANAPPGTPVSLHDPTQPSPVGHWPPSHYGGGTPAFPTEEHPCFVAVCEAASSPSPRHNERRIVVSGKQYHTNQYQRTLRGRHGPSSEVCDDDGCHGGGDRTTRHPWPTHRITHPSRRAVSMPTEPMTMTSTRTSPHHPFHMSEPPQRHVDDVDDTRPRRRERRSNASSAAVVSDDDGRGTYRMPTSSAAPSEGDARRMGRWGEHERCNGRGASTQQYHQQLSFRSAADLTSPGTTTTRVVDMSTVDAPSQHRRRSSSATAPIGAFEVVALQPPVVRSSHPRVPSCHNVTARDCRRHVDRRDVTVVVG